jgi:hypothetical protein
VAVDAYEEHVLGLVGSKRDLFDNVVDPEATEDVVGVSKRLLETLVEELAGGAEEKSEPGAAEPVEAGPEAAEAADAERREDSRAAPDSDPELTRCIETLQRELGPRIERILGTGGRLLVVVDRVDETAAQTAERLSETVPVALVDPLTLSGLQRLGEAFPFAGASVHYDAAEQAEPRGPSPLQIQAREKLRAAELLVEQNCHGPAVELLLSAMLAAAADLAGQSRAPAPNEVGVWLHGEILPKGLLGEGQANGLLRALALAQAPELPEALARGLLEDARSLVAVDGAGQPAGPEPAAAAR